MKEVKKCWYRRGLTAILCGALVAGNVTVTAFAQGEIYDEDIVTGYEGDEVVTCGADVFWDLYDGVLTIMGSGDMDSYDAGQGIYAPWYDQRGSITTVVVETGVTGIGDYAFYDFPNLQEAYLPEGLEIIGTGAFENCWGLSAVSVPELDAEGNGAAYAAVIPDSVAFIGQDAFYGCSQLRDVYFLANDFSQYFFDTEADAQTWRYDFSNPYGTKIHVPVTADLAYAAFADLWNQQNSWQPPVNADIAADGIYTITVLQPGWGGRIAADKAGAAEGEEVLLTVTADEGLAETTVSAAYSSDGAAIALEDLGDGQYSFVMPAEGVTVSATFAQAFRVTVRETKHGTVTVSKDKAAAGSMVAVEAAADAGYVLESVAFVQYGNLVKLDAAEDGRYYFEMPWSDAEVVAAFEKGGTADEGYHQIAVKNDYTWAGTYSVESASAVEGEIVNGIVNMTSESFAGIIHIYNAAGEEVPYEIDDSGFFAFVMPASDVTVELQLASYAYIAAEQTEGGTVTVETEKVVAGNMAYVTVEPDEGYVLDTILYNGYGALYAEPDGTFSFEVPSWGGSYSVKAAFVKDDSVEEKPDWTYEDGILTISKPGVMDTYGLETDAPWDEYKESVETLVIEDGVTTISPFAFDDYTALREVILPDTLVDIGDQAFLGCQALERIVIPEGVTRLGYGAFYYCDGLKEVVLPSTLTSIEDEVFGVCTSLESISLPECLEEIGAASFQSCLALTSITIPASVVTIGEDAFFTCTGITDVYLYAQDFSGYGFEPFDMAEAFAGSGATKIHILKSIDPALLTSESGNDVYVWYQDNAANVVNDIT